MLIKIKVVEKEALSLGARASLPAERESAKTTLAHIQLKGLERHFRAEATLSRQGCPRSQPRNLIFFE